RGGRRAGPGGDPAGRRRRARGRQGAALPDEPARLPRRRPRVLDRLGPSEHAVGRHRAVRRPAGRRRRGGSVHGGGRRPGRVGGAGRAARRRPAVRDHRPDGLVDGARGGDVSWIGGDHPNMPWDGAGLGVAPLDGDGVAGPYAVVAGGPDESVAQAEWREDETLYAITDPTGWWNVHEVAREGGRSRNL